MWSLCFWISVALMSTFVEPGASRLTTTIFHLLISPIWRRGNLLTLTNGNCIPVAINNDHRGINRAVIRISVAIR